MDISQTKKKGRVTAETYECPHHWDIEEAISPVSRGVCRLCGAQKEFHNLLGDCLIEDVESSADWIRNGQRIQVHHAVGRQTFPRSHAGAAQTFLVGVPL